MTEEIDVEPPTRFRLRPRWRHLAVAAAMLSISAGWGVGGLMLQRHFHDAALQGNDLGPLARLLAEGSNAATAWPGYAAALFFAAATLRMHVGPPEPPAGRPPRGRWTATEMRARLRGEYRWVRVAAILVTIVAAADCGRAVSTSVAAATGWQPARQAVVATIVEAVGLVLAAITLGMWLHTFRRHLERWGAL